MSDFLTQLQRDLEAITSAEFGEVATFSDGETTITLKGIFDEAVASWDPDTESRVLYPGSRITVAETVATAAGFNLRRGGLAVTVRGMAYKIRASDWEFDGLGQLVIYLDKVTP